MKLSDKDIRKAKEADARLRIRPVRKRKEPLPKGVCTVYKCVR